VNGGDITSTATTFNLLNATVTNANVLGAANTVVLGGTGGTTTIRNAGTNINGTLTVTGVSVHQGAGSFNSTLSVTGVSTFQSAILANGGTITSSSTTFNLLNTTVTNANVFGAADTISIGSSLGSATIRNANTAINGTLSVTGNATFIGDISVNGGDINSTGALTITAGGSNTNINIVPNGSGTVDVASKRITNLFTPSLDTDAATKKYVDDIAQGLHIHSTATAATTAKLATLAGVAVTYSSGTQAIIWTGGTAVTSVFTDGQALTASTTEASASRILVKNEGDSGGLGSAYNGAYYCYGARELRRATDGNVAADWAGGDFLFVLAGTLYNNTGWVQTEKVTTLDTDPILWEQFSGAGTYTADEVTLTRSGTQFSIKNTYAGQTSINTVGTISTGTWSGSAITIGYGGTGLTTYTAGDILYYASGTALSKLPIGSITTILESTGSAPSWVASSGSGGVVRTISATLTGATLVNPIFTTVTATDLTLSGDIAVNGGDITSTATTFNLLNATVTNANVLGAANTVVIGGTGGTATIRNAGTNINGTLTVTGASTFIGDIIVRSGDIETTSSVFTFVTNTASTINIGTISGSTIAIGNASGTTTIRNAGTNINGTLTVTGATVIQGALSTNSTLSVTSNAIFVGSILANGGTITSTATTFNLLNTTVTNANVLGAATIIVIGANSSGTALIRNSNILLGGTVTGTTTISTTTGTAAHLTISPQGNLTLSPLGSIGAGGIRPSVTVPNNSAGTGTISISGAYVLIGNRNDGGSNYSGEIRIQEQSGNDYFGLKTADTMAASTTYTLPSAFPASAGYVLQSTTTGLMTWAAPSSSASLGVTATSASENYKLVFTDVNATNTSASLLIDTTSGIVYNPSTDALVVNGALSTNSTLSVTGNATFVGSILANGGTITSTATTFNLLNTTVTNANVLGAASTISVMSTISGARLNIGSNSYVKTGSKTTTTTAKQEIFRYTSAAGTIYTADTFFADLIITANFYVAGTNSNSQITKMLVVSDAGEIINHTEYGNVNTAGNLATYTAELSGLDVIIYATPTGGFTTVFNTYATLIKGSYGANTEE
jgi:predicted enzyme related to lactoylglutathione lyase